MRTRGARVVGLGVGAFGAALALWCAPALADVGFTHVDTTPGCRSYTVPSGFTALTIDAVGGDGGNAYGSAGGSGGSVSGSYTVSDGESVYVCVGTGGGAGTSGGGYTAGNGGGASGISSAPNFSVPLIVAGGGGGAGTAAAAGGNAGAPVAGAGANADFSTGYGGGGGDNTTGSGGAGGSWLFETGGSGSGFSGSGPGSGGNGDGIAGGGGAGYYGGGGGSGDAAGGGGTDYCDGSVGNCQIGSATAGPSVTIEHLAAQTISFPATAVTYGQPDFGPASSDSGLPITYSNPVGACSIDGGGLVQITGTGSCTVTADQPGNFEYAVATTVTQTFTVNQAIVHIDAGDLSKVYGQTDPTPAGTLRASDFQYSDDSSSSGITGSAVCSVGSHGESVAVDTGVITCATGTLSSANYQFVTGDSGDLTITRATVHVDADADSKVYGSADPTPASTLRAADFQYSDTSSNSGITGAANCTIAAHAAVAGSYTAAITCAPGSLASSNYTFAAGDPAALTINQATIHVDAGDLSKVYGTADPTPSETLRASDFQYSDNSSDSGITGSANCSIGSHGLDVAVDMGAITCAAGTLAAPNYQFVTGESGDLTITPATIHIDADAASAVYGTGDPTTTGTLRVADFQYSDTASNSGITGSAVCSVGSHGAGVAVDTGVITCAGGTLAAANYQFVAGDSSDLTITRATMHVDADAGSKVYGSADPTAASALRAADFQYSDTSSNSGITGAASCTIAGHAAAAGTYAAVISCLPGSLVASNYTFAAGDSAPLTINQATIHVDADAASAVYGTTDPTPSGTLRAADFVGSDTSWSIGLTGSPSCSIATHGQSAGTDTGVVLCLPGSLVSSNYTFAPGSAAALTIQKAVIHVDATPQATTYGQADPDPSATLRALDFQYSDDASSSGITGAAGCVTATHAADVGDYAGATTCQPGTLAAPNYTFVAGDPADLTIDRAVVHVDANPVSEIAGQSDPAATDTLRASDFQVADTASTSQIIGEADCQIAAHPATTGSYTGAVTCQAGTLASPDYMFVAGTPADLTLTAAAAQPGSPPAATTPGMSIIQTGSSSRSGSAVVPGLQVDCPTGKGTCEIRETASTMVRRGSSVSGMTVGQTSFSIAAGATTPVTFVLNGLGKLLLSDHRRLSVTVRVSGSLLGSETVTSARRIVLDGHAATYRVFGVHMESDGQVSLHVKTSLRGRVLVMLTAWNDNIAPSPQTLPSFGVLHAAPPRFVVGRASGAATAAGVLTLDLKPNARGRLLIARPAYRPVFRLWVSYIPPFARQQNVGIAGLSAAPPSQDATGS